MDRCFHLEQRAVAAVPHDAFHAALRTLLEPGLQLLDVHRRRVPDADAAVRHQTVERLLLTAQSWWWGDKSCHTKQVNNLLFGNKINNGLLQNVLMAQKLVSVAEAMKVGR